MNVCANLLITCPLHVSIGQVEIFSDYGSRGKESNHQDFSSKVHYNGQKGQCRRNVDLLVMLDKKSRGQQNHSSDTGIHRLSRERKQKKKSLKYGLMCSNCKTVRCNKLNKDSKTSGSCKCRSRTTRLILQLQ